MQDISVQVEQICQTIAHTYVLVVTTVFQGQQPLSDVNLERSILYLEVTVLRTAQTVLLDSTVLKIQVLTVLLGFTVLLSRLLLLLV